MNAKELRLGAFNSRYVLGGALRETYASDAMNDTVMFRYDTMINGSYHTHTINPKVYDNTKTIKQNGDNLALEAAAHFSQIEQNLNLEKAAMQDGDGHVNIENERLIILLAHALMAADNWCEESRGVKITGDPVIDEGRAAVEKWKSENNPVKNEYLFPMNQEFKPNVLLQEISENGRIVKRIYNGIPII